MRNGKMQRNAHIRTHLNMCADIHAYVLTLTHTIARISHTHTHTYTRVYIHTKTHIHAHIYIQAHKYACLRACIFPIENHVRTHMHTHTHTHAQTRVSVCVRECCVHECECTHTHFDVLACTDPQLEPHGPIPPALCPSPVFSGHAEPRLPTVRPAPRQPPLLLSWTAGGGLCVCMCVCVNVYVYPTLATAFPPCRLS